MGRPKYRRGRLIRKGRPYKRNKHAKASKERAAKKEQEILSQMDIEIAAPGQSRVITCDTIFPDIVIKEEPVDEDELDVSRFAHTFPITSPVTDITLDSLLSTGSETVGYSSPTTTTSVSFASSLATTTTVVSVACSQPTTSVTFSCSRPTTSVTFAHTQSTKSANVTIARIQPTKSTTTTVALKRSERLRNAPVTYSRTVKTARPSVASLLKKSTPPTAFDLLAMKRAGYSSSAAASGVLPVGQQNVTICNPALNSYTSGVFSQPCSTMPSIVSVNSLAGIPQAPSLMAAESASNRVTLAPPMFGLQQTPSFLTANNVGTANLLPPPIFGMSTAPTMLASDNTKTTTTTTTTPLFGLQPALTLLPDASKPNSYILQMAYVAVPPVNVDNKVPEPVIPPPAEPQLCDKIKVEPPDDYDTIDTQNSKNTTDYEKLADKFLSENEDSYILPDINTGLNKPPDVSHPIEHLRVNSVVENSSTTGETNGVQRKEKSSADAALDTDSDNSGCARRSDNQRLTESPTSKEVAAKLHRIRYFKDVDMNSPAKSREFFSLSKQVMYAQDALINSLRRTLEKIRFTIDVLKSEELISEECVKRLKANF